MKRTRSLHRYFSTSFCIVAVLPILIMAGLAWKFLIPHVGTDIDIQHESLARGIAGQISTRLAGAERQLLALSQFISTGRMGPGREIEELMDAFCDRGDLFETIYLASGREKVITHVGLARMNRLKKEDFTGLDLSGRHLISGILDATTPTWSETFLSTVSSRMAVALTIPVNDRLVIGEMTLDRFSELLSHLPVQGHFVIMVLDRNGRIIADSKRRNWSRQLELSALASDAGQLSSSHPFVLNGQKMLGTMVNVSPLGWRVLVAQPTKTAYAPLTATFILLVSGLGLTLIITLLTAGLQAGRMDRHIQLFTLMAREISQGRYDMDVPYSRITELATLGQSLARMAGRIRRREKDLTESEMRLDITLNSIGDAVIATDTSGRITRMNPMAERLTGWPADQGAGRHLNEVFTIVSAGTREPLPSPFYRVMPKGNVQGHANHSLLVARDGTEYQISDSSAPIRQKDGTVIGVVLVFRDETEQKKARKEIDRLHAYQANVIDAMPSALIGVDRALKVTRWNRAVEALTGISGSKALGMPLETAFPRIAALADKIRESMASKSSQSSLKFESDDSKGGIRYEDIVIYPLTHAGSEYAVIRIDDVTEKVRMEEMMIQNEKVLSLGGLAAGMAHEINNPLAGVIQNASLLANRLTGKNLPANVKAARKAGITMEAVADFMEDRRILNSINAITESGQRMATIVDNMLSFVRKGESSFSNQDPSALMDKAVELARTYYSLKKNYDFKAITIEKEYENHLPMIACEANKIQQVFLNILNNGAHAMFEKNTTRPSWNPKFNLRISFSPETERIRFEINDNGTGMDEATRKNIFDPFFTTKPVGTGTGLGLSVSYFIITENHGGDIEVVSEPGQGTSFIISLPLTKA